MKRLISSSFPEYEVLDGQQRLTTFFIMMAVLRDLIQNEKAKNTIHKKIYQEEDILENVPARMRITYKIRDRVEDFINDYIILKDGTADTEELEHYRESDNLSLMNMANAIIVLRDYFIEKQEHIDLQLFVKFIFNKALFIYVSTDNTEDAFRLFTILNNKFLNQRDILKSQNIGALKMTRKSQNMPGFGRTLKASMVMTLIASFNLLGLFW